MCHAAVELSGSDEKERRGKTMKILRIPLVIVLVVLAGRAFNAGAQTETILYSFGSSPTDGVNPEAGLVQGSDGNFYGTTVWGGTYGTGTVFRISPSGSYTSLYSFGSSPDGANPVAGLVQGSDGSFYGTTEAGGTSTNYNSQDRDYGGGTVFRISPSGSYTNLNSFGSSPTDGLFPDAGLVQGSDGSFYGTTESGGAYSIGTVFRISPSGTYTSLNSVGFYPTDGAQTRDGGALPEAGLVQGSDGNFYGTTSSGGAGTNCNTQGYWWILVGCGTVFRISPSGSYTRLHSFGSCTGPGGVCGGLHDGREPVAGLVQGSDGNFYGTTSFGGNGNGGTVFRISPSGNETVLYSFGSAPNDGWYPVAGLVQGSDGNFYGTTEYGGTNFCGCGTVFRISPSGIYTQLYSFGSQPNDAQQPMAGLVQGSDGNFYGTTYFGGTSTACGSSLGCGTVFKLDVALGPINTNCTFSINPTNAMFDAAGGSDSVSVTASNGCAWTASSNDGFITITSGIRGWGDGTVDYTVAANTSSNELTGTMTTAGLTFTVVQSGVGCNFLLDSTSATYGSAGGSSNIMVTANGTTNCPRMAASNSGFITITSGSSGSGDGTVSYTVAANSGAPRSGTMTIAGQTFAVYQAGATPVTYSFSTPVQTLKTRLNKKTGVTTTNCTITVDLVVTNTGATKSPKFSVLLWLEQGSAFNPSVGLAPLTKKLGALKAGKSVTIKIKSKKLNGDQAGTFIFATDTDNNVLASVEVPGPE
jgi:uncharacterized repeat protein (TIGR03803 family)